MLPYSYDYDHSYNQDRFSEDQLIEDIWAQDDWEERDFEVPDIYASYTKKKDEIDIPEYPETAEENLIDSHVQYALGFDKNSGTSSNKSAEIKKPQKTIKLYNDLPSAKEEALASFEEHFYNIYHSKDLGESGQEEVMTCECKSEWNGTKNLACSKNSDCINRLTSVECTDDCNCGEDCQNRRFKLRQYSDIDVIKTKKKGYGIRANSDLESGQFVCEYVGEVIDERKFRRRMKIYSEENMKHFYFMMLQRGEQVGLKGEELTFDYNVDRYGAVAQPCYCEEPGCIGIIGGKTQTEFHSKIPQNILKALGFENLDFWDFSSAKKIRKKKKGETDEEYYSSIQSAPVDENGVTKIMSALLQCKERWIINRLLLRIYSSDDLAIQRRVMKMHGYQILGSVLRDWKEDFDISNMILNIFLRWPRITKNKISSSKIETTIQILASHENEQLRKTAQQLITEWGNLSMAYRIPKKPKTHQAETIYSDSETSDNGSKLYQSPGSQNSPISNERYSRFSRSKNYDSYTTNKAQSFRGERFWRPDPRFPDEPDARGHKLRGPRSVEENARILPPGWAVAKTQDERPYYYCGNKVQWEFPLETAPPPPPPPPPPLVSFNSTSLDLQKIIDEANAELVGRQNNTSKHDPRNNKNNANEGKDHKHSSNTSKKEKLPLEKILIKTFAKYVPNVITKFQDELGKDEIKKRAKEIVEILVKKEMRPGHEIRNVYELKKVISKKKEKDIQKTNNSHKKENTNGCTEMP
ncbi:hypothetical protein MERGE_002572 [Pneumocystis wakefieldiae]|uniref:AWS domain-containing protein n=1 Tax=Pneumocystis wakefieldiae TaxID=38082 RepID=A0A899FXA9_9ASCO|nr:hypothetical protein MERGE_002572 [Pneumocystis wakefieldiae]